MLRERGPRPSQSSLAKARWPLPGLTLARSQRSAVLGNPPIQVLMSESRARSPLFKHAVRKALFQSQSFDPDTVALMGRIFDSAIEDIKRAGISFDEPAESAMAKRILRATSNGERDSGRLMRSALDRL
jgi:hypothetical protein